MKNAKKYLSLIVSFMLITEIYSQQVTQFTQYKNAQVYNNTGFAGMGLGICINGIVRQQWSGFKGMNGDKVAPQDVLISIDSPIKLLHGGAGLTILQDKIGFEQNTIVQLAYSYHMELSTGILGIGVGVNLTNRNIDFSKFKPREDGDNALLSSKQSDMIIDANVGLFYQGDNDLFLGISAKNFLENHGKNFGLGKSDIRYYTDRTYFLTAGYPFEMPGHPEFVIEPSVLVESDFSSAQYNLSTIVNYNSKFWGGINYRLQESVDFIVGVRFHDFRIMYSYGVTTRGVGIPGNNEVSINYCFKIKADKTKTSYKNTRFL